MWNMWKWLWFLSGTMTGLILLSLAKAAVPAQGMGAVTNDTALYQNLSDIRVAREAELNFDSDIIRLTAAESRYKENLPSLKDHPRLKGPMYRVAKHKYHYTESR